MDIHKGLVQDSKEIPCFFFNIYLFLENVFEISDVVSTVWWGWGTIVHVVIVSPSHSKNKT